MSDDEEIRLPADTLAILNQFMAEKQEREQAESNNFEEDWQLSQFWYNEKTKEKLAAALRHIHKKCFADQRIKIGLFSCPSLYEKISENLEADVYLFEFDQRFSAYANFIQYDYTKAAPDYLKEYDNHFDIIICDPPFLSEECIQKTAAIVKKAANEKAKIILCSGKQVEEWAQTHLGVKIQIFEPEHERNLSNQFCSYANFALDEFIES